MTAMYQLTQLGHDLYRERLADAEAQRRAARQARRLRAQLQAQTAHDQ
jgi:hypothetical protein